MKFPLPLRQGGVARSAGVVGSGRFHNSNRIAIAIIYSVANYDLYTAQAKLVFIFINHKLMIKHAIECIAQLTRL